MRQTYINVQQLIANLALLKVITILILHALIVISISVLNANNKVIQILLVLKLQKKKKILLIKNMTLLFLV